MKKNEIRNCFLVPTPFSGFGKTISHIVCFDENGSSSALKHIEKAIKEGVQPNEEWRYFTLTGVLFSAQEFANAAFLLSTLKKQYWKKDAPNVLLHSRDIRRKLGFFNLGEKTYNEFIASLSNTLEAVCCKTFSISFDLYQYAQYSYSHDPYSVAFDFLTRRILNSLKHQRAKIAYVFEARGKKEDAALLEHAKKLLYKTGATNYTRQYLQGAIRGVFFNVKTTKDKGGLVYPGIEIADLFSYPIHRFARSGIIGRDFRLVLDKAIHRKDTLYHSSISFFPKIYYRDKLHEFKNKK